jgi:cytochrome c peroxidase
MLRRAWPLVAVAACSSPSSETTPSVGRHGTNAPAASEQGADISPGDLPMLAKLSPAELPSPQADPTNRFADNPKAIAFGQKLFFDPGFSGKLLDAAHDGSAGTLGVKGQAGKVACVSCHDPAAAFVDTRSPGKQISLGAAWGRRRARSLLDAGQSKLFAWDGRFDSLHGSVVGAIESPVDMNSSRLFAAEQIFQRYKGEYEGLFGPLPALGSAPFPQIAAEQAGCQTSAKLIPQPTCNGALGAGMPGDPAYDALSFEDRDAVTRVVVNMGKALAAYVRALTCGPSRFDAWVHGKADALTPSEKRGATLFVGRGACTHCHSGPYLSDETFHNVGLKPVTVATGFVDAPDRGATIGLNLASTDPLSASGKYSDAAGGADDRVPSINAGMEGAFLTPRLRCSSTRPSFMHTGQLTSLEAVVEFFNRGGDAEGFPGANELHPLGLAPNEVADLVAFLKSLDGAGPPSALLSPR